MIERFYYLREIRDGHKHRCGIVFLVKTSEYTARGVSLCNEDEDPFLRDQGFVFDKKAGKIMPFEGGLKKARRRALRALNARVTSGEINNEKAGKKTWKHGIAFKSAFNPKLSSFEEKLFEGRN